VVPPSSHAYVAGAAYVDLFCGPGRARIREDGSVIDGSPLVALRAAGGVPFSEIHLGDLDPNFVTAAVARIKAAGGNAEGYVGSAEETAQQIVSRLNPAGLHFAFLDPYNLESLNWKCISALAALQRIDLLLHVSVADLQRNFDRYSSAEGSPLDAFAPGWRDAVSLKQSQHALRAAYVEYWRNKTKELGFISRNAELVTGSKNQRLYWLIFLSRNEFANTLWDKIRHISGQQELEL
jgi:three-Cys-motif partner protein